MITSIKRRAALLLPLYIMFFPAYTIKKQPDQIQIIQPASPLSGETKQDTSPAITIWIHGTRLLPKGVLANFSFSKPGLNLVNEYDTKYHIRTIAETLITIDPAHFPRETFYIFGWSGKLDTKERKKAAKILNNELKKVIKKYRKKYGVNPTIRIITHSHGGNVALNLAAIKKNCDTIISIDELILLACPVQEKTKNLTKNPMFKNIYSLYSTLDFIQVLDPQGLHKKRVQAKLFSERTFQPHKTLIQAKIKINKRNPAHIEFIMRNFLSTLPKLLNELRTRKQRDKITEHVEIYIHTLKETTENNLQHLLNTFYNRSFINTSPRK